VKRPATISLVVAVAVVLTCVSAAGAADVFSFRLGVPGHPFTYLHRAQDEAAGLEVVTERRSNGIDQSLRIGERGAIWSATVPSEGASAGAIRSVDWFGPGEVLLTCGPRVLVLGRADSSSSALTKVTWSYDDALISPCWARRIVVGGEPLVLIADSAEHRVFAVSADTRQLVWQYGTTGEAGTSAGRLTEPVCAEYLGQGTGGQPTVLIVDAASTEPRVIEVRWTGGDVVWQLTAAAAPGGLARPVQAQRLLDGSTLITDAGQDRVFAVDQSGVLRWQYGVLGTQDAAPGYLSSPAGAIRLSNGATLIVDAGNRRLIEVDTSDYRNGGPLHGWDASSILWRYPSDGAVDDPSAAQAISGKAPDASGTPRPAGGAVLLCDRSSREVVLLGNNGGAKTDSAWIDCGHPALRKRFLTLLWTADVPAGTSLRLWYAGSDGVWRPQGSSGVALTPGAGLYRFPAGFTDKRLKYTVSFATQDRLLTPTLFDLTLAYVSSTVKAKDGHGGASKGAGTTPGSGSRNVSGIGGSGGGTGSGSGSGGGSGTGSGPGSGPGEVTGGATTDGGAGSSQGLSGPPVASATTQTPAGAVPVVGVRVGSAPSGGTRGAGGGSAGGAAESSSIWPFVVLGLIVVGTLLVIPGLVVNRTMRRLCAYDHLRRPRVARPITR
jgi:hypothetical protein